MKMGWEFETRNSGGTRPVGPRVVALLYVPYCTVSQYSLPKEEHSLRRTRVWRGAEGQAERRLSFYRRHFVRHVSSRDISIGVSALYKAVLVTIVER